MNLSDLNSATKYPAIPTYHALAKGRLTEEVAVTFDGLVYLAEKVDGTSARVVLLPGGDYFLGSREELLYARDDRIETSMLGIVPALKPIAERLAAEAPPAEGAVVYFFEVYGGDLPAARQYTATKALGARLFDVIHYSDREAWRDALVMEPTRRASWREAGGQPFLAADALADLARLLSLPTAPRLDTVDATLLPVGLEAGLDFIRGYLGAGTRCGIDHPGNAEGLVLRSADRRRIAKMRVEDYGKALGRRW